MGKFKFRLEVLLKMAKSKEDKSKKELADWRLRKQECLKRIESLHMLISDNLQRKNMQNKVADILIFENYTNSLRKELVIKNDEAEYFENMVKKALVDLQEHTKERKILEKLKEKKKEEHQKNEDMILQKQLDEIAGNMNKGRG